MVQRLVEASIFILPTTQVIMFILTPTLVTLSPSDVEEKDTVLAGTYYFTPDEVEVFYLP